MSQSSGCPCAETIDERGLKSSLIGIGLNLVRAQDTSAGGDSSWARNRHLGDNGPCYGRPRLCRFPGISLCGEVATELTLRYSRMAATS
jgi:hypothetical protein